MRKSLALVPAEEVLDYYSALYNNIKKDKDAKKILDWFTKNYIGNFSDNPLKKIVAPRYDVSFWAIVGYGDMHFPRTQNNAESWHHRLQVK